MVRPQEVKAPKEKIEVLAILEDGTKTRKGYSVALVKWYAKKAIAIRWDGDDAQDKGFPVTANGYHPAWFVLPDKLTELYSKEYKELVSTMRFMEDLNKKEEGLRHS